jgi:GMP synthase (glutamine-hydrolysing)
MSQVSSKPLGRVCVLDFGGQYAHLIANRVRRLGVYSEILMPDAPLSEYEGASGIIFSGGPSSVYEPGAPTVSPAVLELGLPVLGICYGHQLIAQTLGGTVQPGKVKEYGIAKLGLLDTTHPLLAGMPQDKPMWMSHGDKVSVLPEGCRLIASTPDCDTAAVAYDDKRIYGIQFHPEVTHSEYGEKLMSNFLDICQSPREWNMQNYLRDITERLRAQVADKKVFLLVSGGVDSTVAFVLLNKVLGKDRVLGLHVDTGMMRLDESDEVVAFLNAEGMDNLRVVDASADFLAPLAGQFEPERKRKIIGQAFLDVKDKEVARLDLNADQWLLAQGTIYPDTIESGGTQHADTIKTHHNRVQSILDLLAEGKLVEPLADLYKDEVRALGEELGIPKPLVWRHPFPGPGLGVRLLCSEGQESPIEPSAELVAYAAEQKIQGCVLPIKSVGVQGDARTYAHPFCLQTQVDWDRAEVLSTELTNRFALVNRVVLQAGPEAPVVFDSQRLFCEKEPLDLLRKVDHACTVFLRENGLYDAIWQMPVVLLPLTVEGKPVIVLRPVESTEAMTASFYPMEKALLARLWDVLSAMGIGALLYDITHKPPGTIEWE